MNKSIMNAYTGAAKSVDHLLARIDDEDLATDDDLVAVYAKLRGNPQALTAFAIANAPPGSHPVSEALKYEQAMEPLYQQRHPQPQSQTSTPRPAGLADLWR